MRIILSDEDYRNVIDALGEMHRNLMEQASSWSADLEGDYDRYFKLRQDELEVARTIHSIKKQRASERKGEAAPMAEWEKDLLNQEPV